MTDLVSHAASATAGQLAGSRVLVATLGSVTVPRGGMQARTRLAAHLLTGLGAEVVVASTTEPAIGQVDWARSVRAPSRTRASRTSLEWIGLLADASTGCDAVLMSDPTLLPALTAARVRLPLVWDTNECQSLHFGRLPATAANRAQRAAWLGFERWAADRCTVAVAIGEVELATWHRSHPPLRPKLAVVDHAPLWSRRDPVEARDTLRALVGQREGPTLLFLGTMRAKQNTAAAQWIREVMADRLPAGTTVVLCGPGSESMSRPAGRGAAVVGLGSVDDVDSVVAGADLCLAPLGAGAGVKTKVLHYLAHGRLVAGTPIAFEGIDSAPGLHAADLDELPELVVAMCRSDEAGSVRSARQSAQEAWLEAHHGTTHITQQWREVFGCLTS